MRLPLRIVQHLPNRLGMSLCRGSSTPEKVTIDDFPGAVKVKVIARGSTCHVYKIYYPEDGVGPWTRDTIMYGNPLVAKVYASDHHARKTFLTETRIYHYQNRQYLTSPIGHGYVRYRFRRNQNRAIPIIVQKWYPCNLAGLIRHIESHNPGDDHCGIRTDSDACSLCPDPSIVHRLRLAIAMSAMQNLEIFHRMGLVHCDIKPDNILLNYSAADLMRGRGLGPDEPAVNVTFCDFGFSRIGLKSNHESPGTVHYSAPEAARGDRHLGPGADWWSYACTIFELITGMTLFDVYETDGTIYRPDDSLSVESSQDDGESHYSLSITSDEADGRAMERYWELVKMITGGANISDIIYLNLGSEIPGVAVWAELIKNNLHSQPEERRGFRDYSPLLQSVSR